MVANSGTKLHRKNGAIYVSGPKGTGTKAATKAQYDLNLARDQVDVTTFGDTNKTYVAGLRDLSGTFAGVLDVSGDLMLNSATGDPVSLYLYADDGVSPILLASGFALIDAVISVSNTDAIRISGNFRASAAWYVFAA